MTLNRNSELPEISRRGFPVYMQNPTIPGVPLQQKERAYRVSKGNQMMLVDEATGEIAGHGVAAFLQREVVDPERFVKVYLGALDDMFSLTKTGHRVFKMLWEQVQANPDTDRVELTPLVAKLRGLKVSPRLFQLGVRELLEKGFIFMSPVDGVYFTNVQLIFNGNRVVVAKEYILQGTQQSFTFEKEPDRPALEAPSAV